MTQGVRNTPDNPEFSEEGKRRMSQPKIIKRYQNRKLYDTESSRYVTLDDIADMIKNGDDIMVLDNKSKDDLTSVTLAQIIFEEEKKHKSILPLDALKKVIRTSGESLTDIYEKLLQPTISHITGTREEVEKVIGRLVKRGRVDPEEGHNLMADIKLSTTQMQRKIDGSWQQIVDALKGVSQIKRELARLESQVEELTNEVTRLKSKGVIKS